MAEPELKKALTALLESQRLAVLSTYGEGQPYASLVAFAASDDLATVCFATTRATRKYANLTQQPCVAFLIDNRENRLSDFHEAAAATGLGRAKELDGDEREQWLAMYLEKHPHLENFVTAPTSALFGVTMHVYYVVNRFQHVTEYHIG